MLNYKYEQRKLLYISILSCIAAVVMILSQSCSDKIYQSTIYQSTYQDTTRQGKTIILKGSITYSETRRTQYIKVNIDSVMLVAYMDNNLDIYKLSSTVDSIDKESGIIVSYKTDTTYDTSITIMDHVKNRAVDAEIDIIKNDYWRYKDCVYMWRGVYK